MLIKDLSNAALLVRFENICFRVTNYPSNKKLNAEFCRIEKELSNRLNISAEELKEAEEEV